MKKKRVSEIFTLCAFLAYLVFTNPQNPYAGDAWKLVILLVLAIVVLTLNR